MISLEVICNILVWTTGVLYSIYKFATAVFIYFQDYSDNYHDFEQGWDFIGGKKDSSDSEWNTLLRFYSKSYILIPPYLAVSEFFRERSQVAVLKYTQLFSSLFFMCYVIDSLICIFMVSVFLSYELISKLKSKIVIWVFTFSLILSLSSLEDYSMKLIDDQYVYGLAYMITFWCILRLTSYHIDHIGKEHEILNAFCYCFYTPLLVAPFVTYSDFKHVYFKNSSVSLAYRLKNLLLGLVRFGFWLCVLEFSLHFVYVNAISYHPEIVYSFDNWTLMGYGYTMGQYFHIKYLFFYGISSTVAKFENVVVPNVPKCIGRIHLYTDMWRYFDVGLYNFLSRYIYIPLLCTTSFLNKLAASFVSFTFIYLWHGTQSSVFIWTFLNFTMVTIENAFKYCYVSGNYSKSQFVLWIGPQWERRLACVITSPLTAASIISNFYFFGGIEIGNIFFKRIYENHITSNILILFFIYNMCQTSTELRQIDRKKKTGKCT